MLNNAIDHSGSDKAWVVVGVDDDVLNFTIRDYGVGVFRYKHPDIQLEPINMTKSVELMVRRALSDKTGEELF